MPTKADINASAVACQSYHLRYRPPKLSLMPVSPKLLFFQHLPQLSLILSPTIKLSLFPPPAKAIIISIAQQSYHLIVFITLQSYHCFHCLLRLSSFPSPIKAIIGADACQSYDHFHHLLKLSSFPSPPKLSLFQSPAKAIISISPNEAIIVSIT